MARTVTEIDYTCEQCGNHMVRATSLHDPSAFPEIGDITVCIKCGSVGTYIQGEGTVLTARRLTGEEFLKELHDSDELAEVLTAWRTLKKKEKELSE
jgi:hypothetical protein